MHIFEFRKSVSKQKRRHNAAKTPQRRSKGAIEGAANAQQKRRKSVAKTP
jgi:hypothetical protein